MSKESFKRPTTEVFKKASEKNLLGKEKDWCNPKNLPEIRDAEDVLKKEEAEVKYDSGQYLVNNLWLLLGKTSLDSKARTLAYQEIRSAWDTAIDDAHNSDGEDSRGFKEKKIYNLYWLSSRFKLPEKCKKLQLKDGEIRFLDKDGKAILSFSVDLKSSARRMAESAEMVEACKDDRKEKGKKTAEKIVEQVELEAEKPVEIPKPSGKPRGAETEASIPAEKRNFEATAEQVESSEKVELSFLDKARNFSDVAIKKAKSQRAVAAGERRDRRGEEESKPIEVVEPMKPAEPEEAVEPVETVKPAEIPAPNGTARPAETAESAPFGRRSAEAAKPAKVEKPVEAVTPEVPKPVEAPKKAEPAKVVEVPEPAEPEEEKVEAAGNVYKELPDEVLPLLNKNGRFSMVILGGRGKGEGDGEGLFDTMKQVVYDPASNKLVLVSYARDAFLPDGKKLNWATKRKPDESRKVLGELSGEDAPYYLTIGMKEAVDIFNIIINDITGPIKIDLPENYVVDAGSGREYFFPKKTVISGGNTMFAFMRFRHGWVVPDDYVSTGYFSESKMKKYPKKVGADDSTVEAKSRMARQTLGLKATINALKGEVRRKGKGGFLKDNIWALGKLALIISENTNLPFSVTEPKEIQGLIALAEIFGHGGKEESLSFHWGKKDDTRTKIEAKIKKLQGQLKSKFPTNIAFYEQRGKKLRE